MTNTVILIDDDQDDLEILQESILAANPQMKCLAFTDAEEALSFICDDLIIVPGYVFTDINMPTMTGEQVVAQLRGSVVLEAAVICVVSTSIQDGVKKKLTGLGANHVFQKPANFKGYVSMLEHIFSEPAVL